MSGLQAKNIPRAVCGILDEIKIYRLPLRGLVQRIHYLSNDLLAKQHSINKPLALVIGTITHSDVERDRRSEIDLNSTARLG